VEILEYDCFFTVQVDREKQLLFKSSNKARLHDCTCKSSWSRKVGERAPYMCFHQIVLELALYLFGDRVNIEKVECLGTAELAAYLEAME
jgi:hypothetical protein